jgi:nitrogen fixation protein NifU and related proteins
MTGDLSDLYQEVILDHSRAPRNFRILANATGHAEGNNPLCGDHFTVFARIEEDIIRDITFQGAGCAISKASASMMTDALKGQTVEQAQQLFEDFHELLTTGEADEEALGKLAVFGGVRRFPMRVKCAVLAWHAMLATLRNEPVTVTTEEGHASA